MRDHGDALDFDLFDRWRVRLRDVPSTIGWGAVALFLRHLPYDSETMREMEPKARWSQEAHALVSLYNLVGDLFAQDFEHLRMPGDEPKRFETAEPVTAESFEEILALFGGGA